MTELTPAEQISWHCHFMKSKLLDVLSYYKSAEQSWAQHHSNIEDALAEALRQHPNVDQQDLIESAGLDSHICQNVFLPIHRESTLVTVYSLVEASLDNFCKLLSTQFNSSVKLEDLTDKGVYRALRFLEKVARVDLTKMGGERSHLKNLNRLRNRIVHAGSVLSGEPNDKLNKFISADAHLSGDPGERLILGAGFIHESINRLTSFFDKLGDAGDAISSPALCET